LFQHKKSCSSCTTGTFTPGIVFLSLTRAQITAEQLLREVRHTTSPPSLLLNPSFIRPKNVRKQLFVPQNRGSKTLRNYTSIVVAREKNLRNVFDAHEEACKYTHTLSLSLFH
jgi:hypothetical protein